MATELFHIGDTIDLGPDTNLYFDVVEVHDDDVPDGEVYLVGKARHYRNPIGSGVKAVYRGKVAEDGEGVTSVEITLFLGGEEE